MVHIENKVVFYTLNSMRETVYAIQLCMGVCVYIYTADCLEDRIVQCFVRYVTSKQCRRPVRPESYSVACVIFTSS